MIDKGVDSTVLDGYFSDIADAIRGKGGSGTYTPAQMAQAIDDIQTEPRLQTKSATPTESAQVITADSGYDGLDEVDVGAISSSYVGSGITRRSSSDLTASGATVNVPAGYYQSQASKAVANGSAGTPTATKGNVSNHAVTVTPSVTNTAGYINGGTKTGTGVQVSASELVSGRETKTENGTYDVTNLAELVVNVSSTDFIITASNDGQGNLTLDKTFAEISTAYYAGRTLIVRSSDYVIAWYGYYEKGSSNIDYFSITIFITTSDGRVVEEEYDFYNRGDPIHIINATYYSPVGATALSSDVANGKTFINESGWQTGTASGGGGASNIVQGEFTTGSSGGTIGTFTIPYTGSGYPIAMMVVVKGGAYNNTSEGDTDWYNSVNRYDVGAWYMTKSRITSEPTYATSGTDNYGVAVVIYKNSTSTATTYTRTSSMTSNTYSTLNASSSTNCVRFKMNGTTVSYYVGNRDSSTIGLARDTTFQYIAIYSE